LAACRSSGLSEEIAEPVWRLLIDRCIEHEYRAWAKLGRPA
jgi:isochorismate pyruvate lyase